MSRSKKPWFRKFNKTWYVWHGGSQVSLGKDKKEAFRLFYELMSKPELENVPLDSVLGLCDLFLDWCEKNRAVDTYRWYKDRLEAWAKTIPADLSIRSLKPFHVQEFVDGLAISSGTKRNYIRAVKRVFTWATEQGHIEQSPIASMKKPRQGIREVIVPEKAHKAMLSHTHDQQFKDLLVFSWESGARIAETISIEAQDCDLLNDRIVMPINDDKMERAPRVIYLTSEAIAIVQRLKLAHPTGPIFRNTYGDPWTADNTNCRFSRLATKPGVGKKYCFTDYRHTFCHRMLISGVDALTVSILMGHSDPSMVAKVYSHLTHAPDYLKQALKSRKRA